MAFLEVVNLEAFYGPIQALHGISFSLEQGGITTILGANGAGKTTTLRSICGMVKTAGQITFDGDSISGKKTENIVRHRVAHVPEGRGTFVRVTTEENLRLGAYTLKKSQEIADSMERVYSYFPRLKERRNQQAGTLSGGEQQMLAIGRALMGNPKVLLMDEPSEGLAPVVVETLRTGLMRLRDEAGLTIVLVEQNASLALSFAKRCLVMSRGRVVHDGPSSALEADEDMLRRLLGVEGSR